jgi:hypothetical protein
MDGFASLAMTGRTTSVSEHGNAIAPKPRRKWREHNWTVGYFVIRYEKASSTLSDASGRSDRISRQIPCSNQFRCYSDLIPCYSAVISAVNSPVIPLFIPLLFIVN